MRQGLFLAAVAICLTACGSVAAKQPSASTNVVPWVDAAPTLPTQAPPVVIPGGTPPCSIRDLRVTYEGAQGLGGGQLSAKIGFVNVGRAACFLQGSPTLTLLDKLGNTIKTTPSGYLITDKSDPVLLATGGQSRQAYAPFAWPAIDLLSGGIECPSPTAALIRVTLPAGGTQTLSVMEPADRPIRASIAPCHGQIAVGAFQSVELSVEPTPTPHPLRYRVSLPRSVRAGSNLNYTVTFTNTTATPFTFSRPCPNYHEDLYLGHGLGGLPLGKHIYALNCQPVKAIASNASVTFAMVLDVPESATAGDYTLLWAPDEGLDTQDIQRQPISVTK